MFKHFVLVASTLTSVLAQAENRTLSTCPFDQAYPSIAQISSPGVSVNSTGSVAFSFSGRWFADEDPWYLSVLVNNTTPGVDMFSRESFLSVKNEGQNASVCLYQFSSLNATSTGDGCAGIFSDECKNYMSRLSVSAENLLDAGNGACPRLWPQERNEQQRMRDVCGKISGNDWTPTRFSVPNDTCNYPSLPGVDLPDNYQSPFSSARMKGTYNFWGDETMSSYDMFAQQVVPFVVMVPSVPGAMEWVCVTPNNTQAGSQEPAERPWENAAAGWQATGRLAAGAAGLVALMLTS